MRKLATLREVTEITPIEGADVIELASIDGWNCVVKKNEFKVGDLGVYFEIDSFIPIIGEDSPFAFLSKNARLDPIDNVWKARIKSMRLRGQVSQGLLLPVSVLKDVDLSSVFGVTKYEPAISAQLAGLAKGNFPSWITKTDQERVQNLPKVLDMNEFDYEETLKLNGSSMTVFYQTKFEDNTEGVCSRNLQLKLDQEGNTFVDVVKRDGILEKLKAYHEQTGRSLALQGELIGEGIQKNYEKIKGHDFYIFDVFDIDAGDYMLPSDRRQLVEYLGLNHVPVISTNSDVTRFKTVSEIIAYADGPSMNNKVREGVVFKANGLYKGHTFSFKAISNKYLIGHDTDE